MSETEPRFKLLFEKLDALVEADGTRPREDELEEHAEVSALRQIVQDISEPEPEHSYLSA